jgi:predicted acylesterase/phospholipase RssA
VSGTSNHGAAIAAAEPSDEVDARLAGVFEGGGAKGIAYEGALLTLEENGLWFKAVAGASAGAVTAALIGAGYTATELSDRSIEATGTLEELMLPHSLWRRLSFLWRRIGQLREPSVAAVASSDRLEEWLREQLAEKVGSPDPTFSDLRESSGIELTIVAVDIHHRQHRIFNYAWSPTVSVASAAVASSSIPFALPPRRLLVASDDHFAAPIVDGGVWTNFPLFVFEDPEFRTYHGLGRLDATVVGFLLSEPGEDVTEDAVKPSRFVTMPDSMHDAAKRVRREDAGAELIGPSELLLTFHRDEVLDALSEDRKPYRWWNAENEYPWLDAWLSSSWEVPGVRAVRRSSGGDPTLPHRRFGKPRSGIEKRGLFILVEFVRWLSTVVYVIVAVLAVAAVAAVPAWFLVRYVAHGVWWTHVLWWFTFILAIGIGVAMATLFLTITLGNLVLYWPVRRFGGLIASTYVAGSGAPYWIGHMPETAGHVIVRLPTGQLRTTSFQMAIENRNEIVQSSRDATRQVLPQLRGERRR